MNDRLQKGLSSIENILAIQLTFAQDTDKGMSICADYQSGIYNGLILAHSIFADVNDVKFHKRKHTNKTKNKIRHKGKK